MSEKPGTNPESDNNTELEELWGQDTTQLKPGVKAIIFSALKKAVEKIARKPS